MSSYFLLSSSIYINSGNLEICKLNSFSAKTYSSLLLLNLLIVSLLVANSSTPSSRETCSAPGPLLIYFSNSSFNSFLNLRTSPLVTSAKFFLKSLTSKSFLSASSNNSFQFQLKALTYTFNSASTGNLYIYKILNYS